MRREWFRFPEHPQLWIKRPPSPVGRRGAVLLILGVIWFFIGISTLADPYASSGPDLGLFHQALPPWLRATAWITTALVAIASAWRPAGKRDDLGYMALILMPMVRTASFTWAWLVHLIPGGANGAPNGWLGAIVWGTVTVLVFTISGWPETPSFILPIEGEEPDAVE